MSTINLRLRQQVPTQPRTLVLRPSQVIDKTIKDGVTAAVRNGALVYLFRTDNNVIKDRAVSDAAGKVTLSPYDAAAHTVVALRPATWDSSLYTWDNSLLTWDASGQTDGVSVDSQFGVQP